MGAPRLHKAYWDLSLGEYEGRKYEKGKLKISRVGPFSAFSANANRSRANLSAEVDTVNLGRDRSRECIKVVYPKVANAKANAKTKGLEVHQYFTVLGDPAL